ncbi:MAG: mitochondrial fission ELM1 family protein [Planctomycetota bacterium]|nr:mitochondrial fission ELM1 family protein [Planctomycetota bacterium]MDA0920092.1 mitochondrial fission ELM1 family protein [Planctomycetota bacterium]MDA1160653.1 mitochondrial fission ELM1 family protein [Planctomycetota bacterium]
MDGELSNSETDFAEARVINREATDALSLHRQLAAHRDSSHVAENSTVTGRCWCISKGMAGMNSQTAGLATAVGYAPLEDPNAESATYEFINTRMAFPWNCLPFSLIPKSGRVLKQPERLEALPQPRLVVSCGRHGVIPALYLKKKLGRKVFTVHIQDPKCDTSGFDMVLIPKHDPGRGPNVYLTMGALHKVTSEKLEAARHTPEAALLVDPDRPLVSVLLGGKNGYYSFSQADIDRLFEKLNRLVDEHDVRLAVLTSNRTPNEVCTRLARDFGDKHFIWNGQGTNPYFEALALADYIVVTGDSVSMVTEATATGRPVFVEHLTERRTARRFRKFHTMFEEAGLTRRFEGKLDHWDYEPPNDTPNVARLIRERMAEQ